MADYTLTNDAAVVDQALQDSVEFFNSLDVAGINTALASQVVQDARSSRVGTLTKANQDWAAQSANNFISGDTNAPTATVYFGFHIQDSVAFSANLAFRDGTCYFQTTESGVNSAWFHFWTENNTTVDGSGFIKEASPIVKLFSDKAEFNNQCPDNADFEKVGAGHYKIKNTLGFAQAGWYIENPKDANGNVKVFVEYEQLTDNTIEVKTYTPDYTNGYCGKGLPTDIPTGRWIDLRLHSEPKTSTIDFSEGE